MAYVEMPLAEIDAQAYHGLIFNLSEAIANRETLQRRREQRRFEGTAPLD